MRPTILPTYCNLDITDKRLTDLLSACLAGLKRDHGDEGGLDQFLAVPSEQNADASGKKKKKKKLAG